MINIAVDFSRYPSGRFISDGPNSGQRFREEILIPALQQHEKLYIQLDGVRGYPSSFVEEAFGGLVRYGYSSEDLLNRLKLEFNSDAYSGYADDILEAISSASPKG